LKPCSALHLELFTLPFEFKYMRLLFIKL